MTSIKRDHCLVLKYELSMTGVGQRKLLLFSKKCTYQKTELFRAGIKMTALPTHSCPSPPAILFLLTNGLEKIGLKISSVSYQLWSFGYSRKEYEMEENNLTSSGRENNNEDVNRAGTQLFTAPLRLFEGWVRSSRFAVTFMVHLTGTVNNFCLHQIDHLLSKQLWSSVADQEEETTDFKLIASNGNDFPVHKWILAARSPVFADLFSGEEDVKSIHLAVDCTVNEMKQFVKFIYIGELDGLVSHALMQLAAKYKIKTLEDLCKTAFQDSYSLSTDKMAEIAFHMESGSHHLCKERNKSVI